MFLFGCVVNILIFNNTLSQHPMKPSRIKDCSTIPVLKKCSLFTNYFNIRPETPWNCEMDGAFIIPLAIMAVCLPVSRAKLLSHRGICDAMTERTHGCTQACFPSGEFVGANRGKRNVIGWQKNTDDITTQSHSRSACSRVKKSSNIVMYFGEVKTRSKHSSVVLFLQHKAINVPCVNSCYLDIQKALDFNLG